MPFRDGGYDTGYVGKWHMNFSEERNDIHGFDYTAVLKANGHDPERPAALRTFLERPRKKPFFLVASYNNPHNICEWARGDRLPDGDVGTPPAADGCPPLRANHAPPENETDIVALVRQSYHTNKQFPVGVFTDTQWRQYIWAYYRMTEMVDALIGELLDDLDRLGLTENTLIVFLSDHGDCQGAHRFNQKTMFYEESVRVPFIISWRGKLEASVSDYFVQTGIDLFPTLCDFAGVTPPPGLPGRSLKPIVEQREAPPRDYIVCSNNLVQGVAVDGVKPTPHGRMVRSRRYKYCLYSQGERRESLFDIERDPGETRNIAAEPAQAEVLAAHREMLKRYAQAHGDHLALEMLAPGYRPEPFERG